MDKREFIYSESRGYMEISSKGLTTSLNLRAKSPKKKQARFYNTDITNHDFRKSLKKFKNTPYLGYKS